MKPRHLLTLLLVLPFSARVGAVPQADAKLIEITQARIAALYHYHDQKSPPPNADSNPFRPEDSAALIAEVLPGGNAGTVKPVKRDEALLRQAVNGIKITGVVNMGSQLQIVANQLIYKEGSVILVHLGNETVLVRVMKITPKVVTFRLGEAEMNVRL